jgi:hyperosmotically inducible periplasmic protein
MQQESSRHGKIFINAIALLSGTVLAVAALAACDRPAARSSNLVDAAAPGRASQHVAAAPPAESSPPQSTQLPSREALSDTVITGRIKAAILADPSMAGADVSVNTDRGVVMLAGVVKTPEQTAIASGHAQRQDGVMRVDNHLATQVQ